MHSISRKQPYSLKLQAINLSLREIFSTIEILGKKANKEFLPLQQGDVQDTYADVDDLVREFGYKPNMKVQEGINNFVQWYREYHK